MPSSADPVPHASATDRLDGLEGETGREHTEILEQRAPLVGEQADAPVDRRLHRPVPIGKVAHRRGQQRKDVLQALSDALRGQQAHFRGSQLDRQRQAVEPSADVRDGVRVLGGEGELRLGRLGAIDEQLDGRRTARTFHAHGPGAFGCPQCPDLVDLLAPDAQHDPAGHQEAREGRDGVQPNELGGGIHDLLEVVEHDQDLPSLERTGDALLEPGFAVVADAEGVRDRRQQQAVLEHSLEQHEVRSVGEQVLGGVRHLDREAALADPARADEAHHAVLPAFEQLPHLREIVLAADRGRVRRRNPGHQGRAAVAVGGIASARLIEPLGQQGRQIAGHPLFQVLSGFERKIRGGVIALDARDHLLQPRFALGAPLEVDELGHRARGEVVLVLQPRDLFAGRHPPVAVGVDADEHVALREIGAVQLAGRVRPRAELEHDGREVHALDGSAHRRPSRLRVRAGSNSRTP